MNPFSNAKNVFLEKVDSMDYIDLDINIVARNKLEQLIQKVPFQIVLLTGQPGVGKSYLIQQLAKNISAESLHIQLFPFLSLNGFLAQLHLKFLPHIQINKNMTRDEFFKSFSATNGIFLLDLDIYFYLLVFFFITFNSWLYKFC